MLLAFQSPITGHYLCYLSAPTLRRKFKQVSIPYNGSLSLLLGKGRPLYAWCRYVSIPYNGSLSLLHELKKLSQEPKKPFQSPITGHYLCYCRHGNTLTEKMLVSIPYNGSLSLLPLLVYPNHKPLTRVSIPYNGSLSLLLVRIVLIIVKPKGFNPL